MDMNLMCFDNCIEILDELGSKKVDNKVIYYELISGIDYRFMTLEKTKALKRNRFKKIRLAWDYFLKEQYRIKDTIEMLIKARYKRNKLMVFMLANWIVSYEECCKKLDLLKVWNIKVSDCYFDNQTFPIVAPIKWKSEELKKFRKKCRKHNHYVIFGIDPEIKVKRIKEKKKNGKRTD